MANLGGGPKSLWGKLDPKCFGDRAFCRKPPHERLSKSRSSEEQGTAYYVEFEEEDYDDEVRDLDEDEDDEEPKASEEEGTGYDDMEIEQDYDDDESDLDEDEEDEEPRGGKYEEPRDGKDDDAGHVNAQDIDAYWLQTRIFQEYQGQIDSQGCYILAEEMLKVLAEGSDRDDVENKVITHLPFENSTLVKFLLHNRLKVVWCTRLARARDQEERNQIEEEMMGLGTELAEILEELHPNRATAKEREENSI